MPEFIERKRKSAKEDEVEIEGQLQKERVAKINARAKVNGPVDKRLTTVGFDEDGNAVNNFKDWPDKDYSSKVNLKDAQALNKAGKVANDRELFERLLKKRLGKGVTIRKEQ